MGKIRMAGGFAILIYSVEQAMNLLDQIDAAQEARQRNQMPPR
jgi:hypothetical protein